MNQDHPLMKYVAGYKDQKVADRHALIDADGRVIYASPKLLKECKLRTDLPALFKDLVSEDLYVASLSDVLYDINTSEKSIADLKKQVELIKSQGVEAVANRLNRVITHFAAKSPFSARMFKMAARFPTEKGHQNYKEYLMLVKENGKYLGAVAEFEPVYGSTIAFLLHALHLRRQPHELFHVDPNKVKRIISVDAVKLKIGDKIVERNYLAEYMKVILGDRITRQFNMATDMQRGLSSAELRTKYAQPQVVLDFRDLVTNEETPKQLAKLLIGLEDSERTLVIGNASGPVEKAVYVARKQMKEKLGRDTSFKAIHFRTLTYAFHEYKTIEALEKKIKETLYPDANTIPTASVQPDVKDSEGKGLDVLVDRESAEKSS